LAKNRKKHMLKRHGDEFADFEKTYSQIPDILTTPDYVGLHPDGKSLQFVKLLEENTLVAVRLDPKNGNVRVGRLIFSDLFLAEQDSLDSPVEVKFENSINRLTAVANPRQLERVIPGTQFNLKLLYELKDTTDREKEKHSEYYQGAEEEWILKDFQSLIDGMKLLELDYLGGSGTRGYGQVRPSG